MQRSRILAVLALAAGSVACGGSSGGGMNTSTPTAFYSTFAAFVSSMGTSCYKVDPSEIPSLDMEFQAAGRALEARVTAGKVKFDPVQASACAAALQAEGCYFESLPEPASCLQAFAGQVTPGGSCSDSSECAGGSCNMTSSCAGSCVANAGLGQSCATTSCGAGLTCDSTTHSCIPFAPSASGSACGPGMYPCLGGLYCDTTTLTCVPLQGSGASCASNQRCLPGLECVGGATCQPVVPRGGTCSSTTAPCADGIPCVAGICTPPLATGAACSSSSMPGCLLSDYCDATGHCAVLLADGASCTASSTCQSSTCTGGACAPSYCVP